MWEVLLYALIAFCAMVGVLETLRALDSLRERRKSRETAVLVLPLRGEIEEVELILRESVASLEELPVMDARLAIVDCGLSPHTRQLCELFCADYSCAGIFASGEICGIISGSRV